MIVETHNDLTGLRAEDLGRVHVIGIGGVGMNGVARLLVTRGIPTTGSDVRDWPPIAALRALGATIHIGHDVSNLDNVDTVVYSTAIPDDNVELAEARRRGLRVLHRAEALVVAMNDRKVIAVSGTNGKTTTTSMITTMLQRCGSDPSFVIGGELADIGASAHHGSGDSFVVEADESDKTFLLYHPDIALVTNVEEDHMDTYGDLAGVEKGFADFAERIVPGGTLVVCVDDPGAARLADYARSRNINTATYGRSENADLRIVDLVADAAGSTYQAFYHGEAVGIVQLSVPGAHIALNSGGALLAGLVAGMPPAELTEALSAYQGVRRRFELKGIAAGVRVYDDYAYHPTSMNTQLETVRQVAGSGRVIVVFQPYRLYRTRAFQAEIAAALDVADEVIVMEVYGPGEERGPGEGGAALAAAMSLPESHVVFEPSWSAVPGRVVERARVGDLVITMGAPPVMMMGEEILDALTAADAGEEQADPPIAGATAQ
ncbi:MAG: UDP-N-acetylmuramate--L-alanine ligase [Corynebacteriales bacterium]|nr:UDP-N-acetylmuramate--L-alanine ligase [Mycobacteriales bacterium]